MRDEGWERATLTTEETGGRFVDRIAYGDLSELGMRRRIERCEDLIAWQKARELTRAVYETTRDGVLANDLGLAGQLQRASVSIKSNIAEGYERGSTGDYLRFLWIAKGSCAETRSLLYAALDAAYIDLPTFDRLMESAKETSHGVGGPRVAI